MEGYRNSRAARSGRSPRGLVLGLSVDLGRTRGTNRSGRSVQGRSRRRGLTLLEVLLALAIFLIALAAFGTLVGGGNDRGNEARYLNTAARLAQSKLAELEAGLLPLATNSGSFDPPDEAWQWSVQADPQTATLYQVVVVVSRELGGRQFEYSVGQLMLDPSAKGSAARASRPVVAADEEEIP